jgi:hypothetical protein
MPDPTTGLGTFSFTYRAPTLHGMGLSSSSNFAVLYEASQQYLRGGALPDPEAVARAALRFERRAEGARAVAADDVYPITYGGVLRVTTEPDTVPDGAPQPGPVRVEPVPHRPEWIARHVVVGFDPRGERHYVPELLARLFRHPDAAACVTRFSRYADAACDAIARDDAGALGDAVNTYREDCDGWTGGEFTGTVRAFAAGLPGGVLAWKPPGGGASNALIVVVEDAPARDRVLGFLRDRRWWASPVRVTGGLRAEAGEAGGRVRFTAGHRVDFVGVADLGQDRAIGTAGRCCSCAIEPRGEIILETTPPA